MNTLALNHVMSSNHAMIDYLHINVYMIAEFSCCIYIVMLFFYYEYCGDLINPVERIKLNWIICHYKINSCSCRHVCWLYTCSSMENLPLINKVKQGNNNICIIKSEKWMHVVTKHNFKHHLIRPRDHEP